jgi:isopenicillin N synthase-like dioxygenase
MGLGLGVAVAVAVAALGWTFLANKPSKKKQRVLELPAVDLAAFFNKDSDPEAYKTECKKVADAFHQYGVCVVKDPRVKEENNSVFLDMMESYFEGSDGVRDARPEHSYQVGVTPNHVERPLNHCARMGALGPDDKPLSLCPPEKDPKWRFFWRVGSRPKTTQFPDLNADPVIPPEIPQWSLVMNTWGDLMLNSLTTLSEMAAVGFDLPADAFTSYMNNGPHLLAPTGSDFTRFGDKNTVLAGYHYDLNFLTIHGKSRYPGLNIWTRNGERVGVKVPDGCLFVQAGKQIEYMTGGHVLAGFHEVIVTDATVATIDRKRDAGESLWRVSSTLFGHAQSDKMLEPIGHFKTAESTKAFPAKLVGEQVRDELIKINLDQTGTRIKK